MPDEKSKTVVAMPATLTDVVTAVRELLGLVADVASTAKLAGDAIQRRKSRNTAKNLDTLTFGGDGSRQHLERIAAGQGQPEDFSAIAAKLEDTGAVIEDSLDALLAKREFIRQRYGLRVANQLSDLLYAGGGKTSIRFDLEMLSAYQDDFYTMDEAAAEASRILGNIQRLNAGLEELHDLLLDIENQ